MALRFINKPRWDALSGFEPTTHFRHRVVLAIEEIVAGHTGGRAVVVADATVINAYLTMVLGIERDMFFMPIHTSVSCLRVFRDLYALQQVNDCSHLLVSPVKQEDRRYD
jgi:broad specificity phosphatase PhoE